MRSTERRITAEGRRATDRRQGAPAWLRVGILSVTLVIALGVVLFAREMASPNLEQDGLRMEAVDREARLLALDTARRIAPAQTASRGAVSGSGNPSQMVALARAAAPDVAFAVISASGEVVTSAGQPATAFQAMDNRPQLTRDGKALLVSRAVENGSSLVARIPLPPLEPRKGAELWLMSGTSAVLASSSRDGRALGLTIRPIKADGQADELKIGDGTIRRTAIPVSDSDLVAVATSVAGTGPMGLLSDIWIIVIPAGLGIALDTTEARRAQAQAQAAEGRLRDGIESVSDAFVLFDKGGRLILWNQAFQDTFDFGDGVLRRGAFKQDLNQIAGLAIKSDQPATGGRAGAREIELNDGRWLQMVERFTSDGGSVVTAADITAIKNKEAERQRVTETLHSTITELEDREDKLRLLARKYEVAMTRAEAANQAKSEFLANMSHELRTPLNAINGFSEIMFNEMFGPLGHEKYKGYAADILKSGQHLLSLINDILDMAKIEAGKVTLHYERVSLKEVATDAALLMRGKIEESGLKLIIDAPALPDIEADQRGLKQVMLNLISNAVKFTPEGGDIVVALSQLDDERLRVAVTDTGIGIAAKDLARLAQPFEQVEGQHSKTTQGTGLGLALTKSLIELHGGRLVLESEPGRGTTVSFDIPIVRPGSAQPAAEPRQARAA